MDGDSRVFIKHGVAARGFYLVLNFVNVSLVVKYDGGIALVSRNESQFGSLFINDFKAVCCLGVGLSGVLSCIYRCVSAICSQQCLGIVHVIH